MDIRSAWAACPEAPEKETRADEALSALVGLANRSRSQFGEPSTAFYQTSSASFGPSLKRRRPTARKRERGRGLICTTIRYWLKQTEKTPEATETGKHCFFVFFCFLSPPPHPPPSCLVSHCQQDRSSRHTAKDRSNDRDGPFRAGACFVSRWLGSDGQVRCRGDAPEMCRRHKSTVDP